MTRIMKYLSLFVSLFFCAQLTGQEVQSKFQHRISVGHQYLYFNDHRGFMSNEFYWQPRISILFENISVYEYELCLKDKNIGLFLNYSNFAFSAPIYHPLPKNKIIGSNLLFFRIGLSSATANNKWSIAYRAGLSLTLCHERFSLGYSINSFEIASEVYHGILIGPFVSFKPSFFFTKNLGVFTEIGANYFIKRVNKNQPRLVGFGQLGLTYSFQFKKGKSE